MKTHIRIPLLFSLARAAPIAQVFRQLVTATLSHGEPGELIREPEEPSNDMFFMMMFSITLVLLGGVFAGLTIGLMGQDEVYLQVISESGEARERKHARKVLKLLSRGKHWVLVTLLLSNVITNETLPIVLDSFLGGGWPAVVGSTAAIVVFGEIIPQSICVRYGLALGAFFSPYVLALMYLMYPVAYPIAKLLDYILGEDHGTVYKKAGLKTLVTLHRTMGVERLNEDEVTIISAVLDLKDKPIGNIMTPIKDVFVLSSDTILDEAMVEKILLTGFNRIPIHAPRQPQNFIGMLLVRILITYDPEDCLPISNFALATLPETHPETSCLNILNYFQEGKSHMVCVSTNPGDIHGAIGVVTLEDVIEELIGEEIVDESDVFVDVQKAIRRQTPAPARGLLSSVSRFSSPGAKLIPSNRASNPKITNNSKITIKQNRPSSSLPASRAASPASNREVSRSGTPAAANGDIMTETEAMEVNLEGTNLNLSSQSAKIPVRLSGDQNQEDAGIAVGTFTENVVRVGGFNKVIIKDSETASRSSEIGSSSVGSSSSS